MLYGTSEIDAGFYRLIHQLVGPQLEDEPAERRGMLRNRFPATQWIAPRRGPGFPEDGDFFEVRCHDLTRAGFSFFLPSRPDFTSLVAAFGKPPELTYVAAEVLRCDDVILHPSGLAEHVGNHPGQTVFHEADRGEATPMVLVGCRFTERLYRPSGRSS